MRSVVQCIFCLEPPWSSLWIATPIVVVMSMQMNSLTPTLLLGRCSTPVCNRWFGPLHFNGSLAFGQGPFPYPWLVASFPPQRNFQTSDWWKVNMPRTCMIIYILFGLDYIYGVLCLYDRLSEVWSSGTLNIDTSLFEWSFAFVLVASGSRTLQNPLGLHFHYPTGTHWFREMDGC